MSSDVLALYNTALPTERVAELLQTSPDDAFGQLAFAIHQHAAGSMSGAMRACDTFNLSPDEKHVIRNRYTAPDVTALMEEVVGTSEKYEAIRVLQRQPNWRRNLPGILSARCPRVTEPHMMALYCMLAECEILVAGKVYRDEIMARWELTGLERAIVNCNLHPLFIEIRQYTTATWQRKIAAVRESVIIKQAMKSPDAKRAATEELQKYAFESQIESHTALMRLLETKLDAALARIGSCEQTIAVMTREAQSTQARIPKLERRIVELQTAATQAHANSKGLHRDITELRQSTTKQLGETQSQIDALQQEMRADSTQVQADTTQVHADTTRMQTDVSRIQARPTDPRIVPAPAPTSYPKAVPASTSYSAEWRTIYPPGSSSLYARK